jgi:hypothetical protein
LCYFFSECFQSKIINILSIFNKNFSKIFKRRKNNWFRRYMTFGSFFLRMTWCKDWYDAFLTRSFMIKVRVLVYICIYIKFLSKLRIHDRTVCMLWISAYWLHSHRFMSHFTVDRRASNLYYSSNTYKYKKNKNKEAFRWIKK